MPSRGMSIMNFLNKRSVTLGLAIVFSVASLPAPPKEKSGSEESVEKPPSLAIELSVAAKYAAKATNPLEAIPELERWGSLLKRGKFSKGLLEPQLKQTEALIEEFSNNAKKKPSQAKFYQKLIAELEERADSLFEQEDELGEAIAKLEKELKRLRADPKVANLLKARTLRRRISSQVKEANDILPPSLRKVVSEIK